MINDHAILTAFQQSSHHSILMVLSYYHVYIHMYDHYHGIIMSIIMKSYEISFQQPPHLPLNHPPSRCVASSSRGAKPQPATTGASVDVRCRVEARHP